MNDLKDQDRDDKEVDDDREGDGDFSDMLSEMRILLPGAQMLSAFLVILPFNTGFADIVHVEKQLFLATFFFALASLVLLSAPAVQHRVMRPLKNRARFKRIATRQIVAGAFSLGIALVLGTDLVISEVFGATVGVVVAAIMAVLILCFWWALPAWLKRHDKV